MPEFKSGFVALLGAPNVGKSTLLNALIEEKISITCPKPQTTRNRVTGILSRPEFQIVFIDTPGIFRAADRFNTILVETALATLHDMDVICFVVDATSAGHELNEFVLEHLHGGTADTLLLINKIDRIAKPELLPIIDRYRQLHDFKAVVPISALKGDGLERLVDELLGLLPEGPAYYPDEDLTDQPERFLAAEIVREKVFRLTQEEIPYAVAVTVDQFAELPAEDRVRIDCTIHVEKDSQKAIIIGKGGAMIKEIGKQARRDIMRLLGCRVHLQLFVRVQKNWRKDPKALARFGYRSPE